MLNSVEAAVETLEEAGAVKYTISQLPHFKVTGEAATSQELIDKFLAAWGKLGPGIYKVDYSKSAADTRGGLCFRVSKVNEQVGAPGSFGSVGPNDLISGLQQQLWNLQAEMRVGELQRNHEKEIAALKAKHENESGGLGGFDVGGLIGGLGKIENIMRMAQGQAPVVLPALPAVAGPDATGTDAAAQPLEQALTSLQATLGDDVLVQTLQKLAAVGEADPQKLLGMIPMLGML